MEEDDIQSSNSSDKNDDDDPKNMKEALDKISKLKIELNDEKEKSQLLQLELQESKDTMNELQQRYFFSIAMAMKLEREIIDHSYNVQVLWNEVESQNIPYREWPGWLSDKLTKID